MSITLEKFIPNEKQYEFRVPASKSLLNRALVLAAFCEKRVKLFCGAFSEDTRAMLDCLRTLGIVCTPFEGGITIEGCNGNPPNRNAEIDVCSAGTAARFLTVALAFCGGNYLIKSSPQMAKRPMDILALLEQNGVRFEWLGERGTFPFRLCSDGLQDKNSFLVDTDVSTQYASAIALSAHIKNKPVSLTLTGSRTHGAYIEMTLKLLRDFGIRFERTDDTLFLYPAVNAPDEYAIEADVSGACYFYALALLFSCKVLVRDVRLDSAQSDIRFLKLLQDKGVVFMQTETGLLADATAVKSYSGFDACLTDFSDQTLTCAALAPFATSPSHLKGVAHIAKQECDRIQAIVKNLTVLGVRADTDGENITIYPADVKGGLVESFSDHRVAMSFALVALKTGKVTIDNPACCKKTFENYFELLQSIL